MNIQIGRCLTFLSVVCGASAFADLTVTQTIEDLQLGARSAKEQVTLCVSGSHVRFDKGQSLSSIILMDKKITFSIMHEAHRYVALPHDRLNMGFGGAAAAGSKEDSLGDLAVEATGITETISGFKCRQVIIKEKDGSWTELWVAQDALDMKSFLGEFKSFMEFGGGQTLKSLEKYPELRGVPIRIVEYDGPKMVRRATIHTLSTAPIEASVFEVPPGYSELKMSDAAPPPSNLGEEDLKSLNQ